jgi:hypothetical protein
MLLVFQIYQQLLDLVLLMRSRPHPVKSANENGSSDEVEVARGFFFFFAEPNYSSYLVRLPPCNMQISWKTTRSDER